MPGCPVVTGSAVSLRLVNHGIAQHVARQTPRMGMECVCNMAFARADPAMICMRRIVYTQSLQGCCCMVSGSFTSLFAFTDSVVITRLCNASGCTSTCVYPQHLS